MNILVTGSNGLVGYECSLFFLAKNATVIGIDNDMRKEFFGKSGSGNENLLRLNSYENYTHSSIDLRDTEALTAIFQNNTFDLIIHAAAQPSHDYASQIPLIDFQINATCTLELLELTRKYNANATFCYASTNKVYGTNVNDLELIETDTRYDYAHQDLFAHGINENLSIDHTLHSLMGASKLSADIYVQEYGRYFGLNTAAFRCGCITGGRHAGVELHGFLNYIVKCAITHKPYTIFGYKGKQVRDHIHAADLASAFYEFSRNPIPGAVYNMGGGYENAASILEIIGQLKHLDLTLEYSVQDKARIGDHKCYYTDLSKFRRDFPSWNLKYSLIDIIKEIIEVNGG